MQRLIHPLVLSGCLFTAATALAADGLTGGVGGQATGAAGRLTGRADAESRAQVRTPGRVGEAQRAVGPNFRSARVGADVEVGAEVRGRGLRSSTRVEGRVEAGRRGEANAPGANQDARSRNYDQAGTHNRAALQADLNLAARLAEIDRLRDIALANADTEMLLRADVLEREARVQHRHQVDQALAIERRGAQVGVQAQGAMQAGYEAPGQQASGNFSYDVHGDVHNGRGRLAANEYGAELDAHGDYDVRGSLEYPGGEAHLHGPQGELYFEDSVEAEVDSRVRAAERARARARAEAEGELSGHSEFGQSTAARARLGGLGPDEEGRRGREHFDADLFPSQGRLRGEAATEAELRQRTQAGVESRRPANRPQRRTDVTTQTEAELETRQEVRAQAGSTGQN